MIRNVVKFEAKINDKTYELFCDSSSPLADLKEALFQFQKYIGQIEDDIKSQQEKAKAEEAAKKKPEEKVEAIA